MSKENLLLFSSCQIFNNGSSYSSVLVLCLYQIMNFLFIHITTHRERRQILNHPGISNYMAPTLFFPTVVYPLSQLLRIFRGQKWREDCGEILHIYAICICLFNVIPNISLWPSVASLKIKTLTFPLNLKKEILHRRRERKRRNRKKKD